MKRMRKPGELWAAKMGRHRIAISISVLGMVFTYLLMIALRFADISANLSGLHGSQVAFMVATVILAPVVVVALGALADYAVATRQRCDVAGFLATGFSVLPDIRVSPSSPFSFAEGRAMAAARSGVYALLAALGVAAASAQLNVEGSGSFPVYWIGAMVGGWSLMALAIALLELVVGFLWQAPTARIRARRLRVTTLVIVAVALAWMIVVAWEMGSPMFVSVVRYVVGWPVTMGLMWGGLTTNAVAGSQRALARDLRQVAVEAVVVDGASRASEAVELHETPGFLVAGRDGGLAGWVSREEAVGSPDALLSDLAHPLLDAVPIAAELREHDLKSAIDPSFDAGCMVAIAVDGTPVGYIEVLHAFEHVTGNAAWAEFRKRALAAPAPPRS